MHSLTQRMIDGQIPDLGLGTENMIFDELSPWQKILMTISKKPRLEHFKYVVERL